MFSSLFLYTQPQLSKGIGRICAAISTIAGVRDRKYILYFTTFLRDKLIHYLYHPYETVEGLHMFLMHMYTKTH